MKKTLIVLLVLQISTLQAQVLNTDSLKKMLSARQDTGRVSGLMNIAEAYSKIKSPEAKALAFQYNKEAQQLAERLHYNRGIGMSRYQAGLLILNTSVSDKQKKALEMFHEALPYLDKEDDKRKSIQCKRSIAGSYHHIGEVNKAIQYTAAAKEEALKIKDTITYIYSLAFEGHCYFDLADYKKAYQLKSAAWKLAERTKDTLCRINVLTHLSKLFLEADLPQTTLMYYKQIIAHYPAALKKGSALQGSVLWGMIIGAQAYLEMGQIDTAIRLSQLIPEDNTDSDYNLFIGHLNWAKKDYKQALANFKRGYQLDREKGLEISYSRYANEIGRSFLVLGNVDSARYYAEEALDISQKMHALLEMRNASGTLSDIYAGMGNYKLAFEYSQKHKQLNDSLAPEEYKQKLALVQVQNELDNQKQQALLLSQNNRIKEQQLIQQGMIRNFLGAGLIILFLFGVFLVRSNRQKQKVNSLLNQQKNELQHTLTELEAAQTQLIHAEKMASLGELTAGIAHEIQNPLNFINNFSEVSSELIDEMKEELEGGNTLEAKAIADDLNQNLAKIVHHGKRADSIVKNMLLHSRQSTGQKELTDINALVDEYLRLSYHGLRAKDKSFNAILETHFDPSLEKVKVVAQDIGRVILNLFNNAFYSVNEKKKLLGADFEPTVSVRTSRKGSQIIINVRDNGMGIPQKVLDKIYQPFFTTKPTGEGTGLGLSMSYDIITKGHGGIMKAETKEGEFAAFDITLPV